MNWILDETIYNLKSRISALEKVINNEEVNRICKIRTAYEIKDLKEILQEIDAMMQEEVRDLDEADEDIRTLKTDATMGI